MSIGKIIPFKGPTDGCEGMEEFLREFFAAERELENDEVLQEIVRRAKELPRWLSLLRPRIP